MKTAIAVLCLVLLGGCAGSPRPLGAETRALTRLQASNAAAVGWARPLPGDAADRIYRRYLDSFSEPIPAASRRESFSASP